MSTIIGLILRLPVKGFVFNKLNNACACCCLVAKSCPTLCNCMNCSMWGFCILHYLQEFAQTYISWIDDAIQPFHPLLFPSPPAFNLSQHQSLFQWVSSSHQVTKVNKKEHINEILPYYWGFPVSLRPTFVILELKFLVWKGPVFRPWVLVCVYVIILLYCPFSSMMFRLQHHSTCCLVLFEVQLLLNPVDHPLITW